MSDMYMNFTLQYPVFAKNVFGFCLENGQSFTENDTTKVAFPMFVPESPFNSILLESIFNQYSNRIDHLLTLGHGINDSEFVGMNALHFALRFGSLDLVQRMVYLNGMSLLNMPKEVPCLSDDTRKFIFSQTNVLSILKTWSPCEMKNRMINEFIDYNLFRSEFRMPPLLFSIFEKNEESSLFILEHGSEKHHRAVYEPNGTNALHFALQSGLLSVLKALVLEKKMSLLEKDGQGRMPLLWVKPSVSKEMISWIVSLPNFDEIKQANNDTYFIQVTVKNYLNEMAVLQVRLFTALLFTEDKLSKQWILHVQTLLKTGSYSQLKFSFTTAKEQIQEPKIKEWVKDSLIVL